MGNKILRQRLKGPSLAKYYPPRGPTINTLEKEFKSLQLETINEEEEDRLEHLAGQATTMTTSIGRRVSNWNIGSNRVGRAHRRRRKARHPVWSISSFLSTAILTYIIAKEKQARGK